MNNVIRWTWNSPTLTTWASFAARALNLVIVFPFALRQLSEQDVVVWQVIVSILSLQLLLDLGMTPTLIRLISYAMGGDADFRHLQISGKQTRDNALPNWVAVEAIWSTMVRLYQWLAIGSLILLAIPGTLAIAKPISMLPNSTNGWWIWSVIVVTAPLTVLYTPYSILLQGLNRIALLRRWEALTACCAAMSSVIILIAGGRLLALLINLQIWSLIGILRNRQLARFVEEKRLVGFQKAGISKDIFDVAWPAAWRSGLGVIMSSGLFQLSGIVYAQLGKVDNAAAYLIGLRYITAISQFSQAPFYSKLPTLARLHAQGLVKDMLTAAQKGMRYSHWTFVIGVSAMAFGFEPLLALLGSKTPFVSAPFWWLLALAFFVERYGAMHLQLYSVSNHIVWHIANGVTGIIMIIVTAACLPAIGAWSFPVAILSGYIGFYSWYSARLAYTAFSIDWLDYERRSVMLPIVLFIAAAGLSMLTCKLGLK